MRMTTSISITEDLQPYVKAYREKRGSLSDLVCRLLRVYFDSSAMAEPAIAGVLESDLQRQLETLQESVVQIQDRIGSLSAQKVEAKQIQEKQFSELSTLIEKQYDDRSEYDDLRYWVRACGGKDLFTRAMKTRCSLVATKGGVSVEVAKKAILEKYPELEAYL